MGGNANERVTAFFQQKHILKELIRWSLAVPQDPGDPTDSYILPFRAQEVLCNSSFITQALVEGGLAPQPDKAASDTSSDLEDSPATTGKEEPEKEDEEATEIKPKGKVIMKNKPALQIALDDSDSDEEKPEPKKENFVKEEIEKEVIDQVLSDVIKEVQETKETVEKPEEEKV